MARKRARVIPKNVLAQEQLRRKYAEEPWPQKLILVKSTLGKGNDIRVRGSTTGLFYNLSYPYLYIDSRDLDSLGDMVTEKKAITEKKAEAKKEIVDAMIIPRDMESTSALDAITNTGPKKTTRKRGRPRKSSSRSKKDSLSGAGE